MGAEEAETSSKQGVPPLNVLLNKPPSAPQLLPLPSFILIVEFITMKVSLFANVCLLSKDRGLL